jgi:hypothetical protein
VRLLGQRLVVEGECAVGVEAEVELVLPAEVEARAGKCVVALLRARISLRYPDYACGFDTRQRGLLKRVEAAF